MTDPDHSFGQDFDAMYREKRRELHRHARRCLREEGIPSSRLSPEDLVQDALLIAMVNHEEKPISNLGGYVYRVIQSRVRDEGKRKGVADPVDTTVPTEPAHTNVLWASTGEEDVDGRLDAEKILGGMSPQQRRLILLSKGAGFSHAELAEVTGLHRGTIAQHVMRATKALVAALGAVGIMITPVLAKLTTNGDGLTPGSLYRDYLSIFIPDSLQEAVVYAGYGVASLGLIALTRLDWPTRKKGVTTGLLMLRMLDQQSEVREATGSDFPTVEQYARHLGLPIQLTLESMAEAQVLESNLEKRAHLLPLHLTLASGDLALVGMHSKGGGRFSVQGLRQSSRADSDGPPG
ncbi:RNA polymerase sigma factor [Streptomyces erythrochromogenes]|uniref:RNA polymerase sigma factor n=1 Tax=Streptomyces erythrochromogenes TaxID=285574 RepID=UPI0036CB3AEB